MSLTQPIALKDNQNDAITHRLKHKEKLEPSLRPRDDGLAYALS